MFMRSRANQALTWRRQPSLCTAFIHLWLQIQRPSHSVSQMSLRCISLCLARIESLISSTHTHAHTHTHTHSHTHAHIHTHTHTHTHTRTICVYQYDIPSALDSQSINSVCLPVHLACRSMEPIINPRDGFINPAEGCRPGEHLECHH